MRELLFSKACSLLTGQSFSSRLGEHLKINSYWCLIVSLTHSHLENEHLTMSVCILWEWVSYNELNSFV